jgi:hypothetical protein
MKPSRRLIWWVSSIVVLGAASGLSISWLALRSVRPERLKARFEDVVSSRLQLSATIQDLKVVFYPRAGVEGRGLELRIPDRPDLPPFVAIDHFAITAPALRLVKQLSASHVDLVRVDGLRITIPPPGARGELLHHGSSWEGTSRVIVDKLVTRDATLTILRARPNQRPLVFDIHELEMTDLGFEREIAFRARLHNPVPSGQVATEGTIGPWQTAPSDLPLRGTYAFRFADLNTIRGIGGMLTSDGHYDGTPAQIRVIGTTDTPDFNLDLGGKPLPLSTTFTAVVNGANGTTHLESVDARLFHTQIHVTGDVTNLPGPAGVDIRLSAAIRGGRIEDILKLAMDTPQPPFTGALLLTSSIRVPDGKTPVRARMDLNGQFELAKATFTDGQVQRKLVELSLRSQGKPVDTSAPPVLSDLKGGFHFAESNMQLADLSFAVPGARVVLDGEYSLPTQELAFEGDLRTDATLSKLVGGFKSLFIKPFDPIFRRDGAGAVIPIKITGTREHPQFGVRLGAAFTRKK